MPAPGQCKICKCPTTGTDKGGKCPAVARGRGASWAQGELTDALNIPLLKEQLVHASACVCRDIEHAGSLEDTKEA